MKRLIIPGVLPSVNHQYRNVTIKGRRMRVMTTEAAKWERDIGILAIQWRVDNGWETTDKKTIVRLWYYFPDRRKRDTHNTLKLLLDVFEQAGIYTNDYLALPHIMDYEIDRSAPRVVIEFEVMEETA